MRKDIFLKLVADTIRDHPDWFGDMIIATQHGITQKLQESKEKLADAETVVLALYEKVYKNDENLAVALREKAKTVLKNSLSYKGTAFTKDL